MIQKKNSQNNTLTHKKLSIQISLSGLSFCILQSNTNTITTLKTVVFDKKLNPYEVLNYLKDAFESEDFLQTLFDDILLIHQNELSTLVPMSLFNDEYLADYLKFNCKILKSDFITYDTISANNSANVYVPYVNINNFVYEKFGEFTYKHFSTLLIELILKENQTSRTTKMYVHVSKTHFEIVVVNNGELVLYNTFEYKNSEDFIYYVLFTSEQLQLNPNTFNLIFLGDVKRGDALYTIAYKYIRYINFGSRNDNYTYTHAPANDYSNYTLIHSF